MRNKTQAEERLAIENRYVMSSSGPIRPLSPSFEVGGVGPCRSVHATPVGPDKGLYDCVQTLSTI